MARTRGFTLIEMMAVVLILGLVMSVVVVNVMERVEWAKLQTTKIRMQSVEGALEMFQLENAAYPDTDPGLVALLEHEPGKKSFVKDEESLEDSWKHRFEYEHPGSHRADMYDLWSNGRDGRPGGEGFEADVTSWGREGS
ncbi:MAG TPA: type II secretion system major pseudopilin GspG [Myxococcota bacterium]|nr:type II secretion system major pseudopilin GspG [Myxococcota bacterium]